MHVAHRGCFIPVVQKERGWCYTESPLPQYVDISVVKASEERFGHCKRVNRSATVPTEWEKMKKQIQKNNMVVCFYRRNLFFQREMI